MYKNGYTLIELIVAITIVLIISGSIIAFVNVGGNEYSQRRSAQMLALSLRELQSMSLSPKKHDNSYPICFYGLKIDTTKTFITYYAYDTNLTNPCSSSDFRYNSPVLNFVVIKRMRLEPRIVFLNQGNDVVFVPPDASVYFNGLKLTYGNSQIVARVSSVQNTVLGSIDVYINSLGNVYFK